MISGTIFDRAAARSRASRSRRSSYSVSHFDALSASGINCAVGVDADAASIESLSSICRVAT